MIVYQLEHPDYGWVNYGTLDDVVEEIRMEIDANNLFPGELTITIKIVEMSQENYDALPTTDDL